MDVPFCLVAGEVVKSGTKKLVSQWFDGENSSEHFFIGDRVEEIDKII
jgi:hypothetical protein